MSKDTKQEHSHRPSSCIPTCLELDAFHLVMDEDWASVSPGTFPAAEKKSEKLSVRELRQRFSKRCRCVVWNSVKMKKNLFVLGCGAPKYAPPRTSFAIVANRLLDFSLTALCKAMTHPDREDASSQGEPPEKHTWWLSKVVDVKRPPQG